MTESDQADKTDDRAAWLIRTWLTPWPATFSIAFLRIFFGSWADFRVSKSR
jgi:hypothetical protein